MNIGHKYLKIMLSHSESKARVLFSFIISLILVFVLRGTVSAAATYDPSTNTIYLSLGNNTLDSIYTDISNSSALSYDPAANTYTLNAKIETVNDLSAKPCLTISDTTLLVNSTADDEYYINGGWILTITNSTIKSKNGARFRIWAPSIYGRQCKYGACDREVLYATIEHSTIIGGWIYFRIDSDAAPDPPYVKVTNTIIKDVDMTGAQIPSETTYGGTNNNASVLTFLGQMGNHALLENITLENVHGGQIYGGTINLGGSDITLKNIRIINSSHPYWGAIHSFPAPANAVFENITILNRTGDGEGISYKEGPYGTINYFKNIIMKDITGIGFHTYANKLTGPGGARIENLIIDGGVKKAMFLFEHDYALPVNVWVFNAQLKNANIGFRTRNNNYYFTNAQVQNVERMYDRVFGVENGNVNWYELADIYVVDSNGNPISNAAITITPNAIAPVPNVVDKWFNAKSSITTGTNGHTPLPSDETGTVAILRQRDYNSGHATTSYSYTITATSGSYTNSTTVTPDASWYRTDPNTYQNTVVITLPMIVTPSAIDINQDGVIDISDLRIVALHFGETTTSPYPRYDVNADGTVDILDLRQVAGGM